MRKFDSYEQSREFFENGDVVFFSEGDITTVRRCISKATGGPFYHVGIAMWAGIDGCEKLLLAESQPGGYRIVNLSAYRDRGMTVFQCPVPWCDVSDSVINRAGILGYGFFDLILIGIHELFGVSISDSIDGPGDACSVVVAKILKEGGLDIKTMVSPNELYRKLTAERSCKFSVGT